MGLLVINAGVEEVVDLLNFLFTGVECYAGVNALHISWIITDRIDFVDRSASMRYIVCIVRVFRVYVILRICSVRY